MSRGLFLNILVKLLSISNIGEVQLLDQILVLSPSGICYVHRSYNDTEYNLDPHLISAMAAVESSGGARLSDITKILRAESNNNEEFNIDIVRTHNYISCAISSNIPMRNKLREILPQVNQMAYETLGSPNNRSSIELTKINQIESKIDFLVVKNGFS